MSHGQIYFAADGATMRVTMHGEIDLYVTPSGHAQLEQVQPGNQVVVDMTDVVFFDSSAIGLLITLHKKSSHVRLIGVSANIERLLSLTGLAGVFETETAQGG